MGYSKFISYRNEVVPMDPRELSRDTLITACASIPDQVAEYATKLTLSSRWDSDPSKG